MKYKLDQYLGNFPQIISVVKKWSIEFRCGRTKTRDAERSGRPIEVVAPETIAKSTIWY